MNEQKPLSQRELILADAKNQGIPAEAVETVVEYFLPFCEKVEAWRATSKEIVVNSVEDRAAMNRARSLRLEIRKERIEVENRRKSLKEESLRKGQAIDHVARFIKSFLEPIEVSLELKENFAEEERKRKVVEKLAQRQEELHQILPGYPLPYDLETQTDEVYAKTLENWKKEREAKEKHDREALEAERKKKEEDERIRKENERLKEENAKKDEELRKEREERERIEKEAAAKKKAEEDERREKERVALAAAFAPDREKLEALAKSIQQLPLPEVASKEARDTVADVRKLLDHVQTYLMKRCEDMSEPVTPLP